MNLFIKICQILDNLSLYEEADKFFNKIASSKKDILDKRILIPSDVKKNAEEAYKNRFSDLKFGDSKSYELARQLYQRNYLEIDQILDIHEYTVKHRYSRSKSKKQPSYWEYLLRGGDEGRKWASDIIKIYLPKKWKTN